MHKETRGNTSFPSAILPVISSFRILVRRALTTNEGSKKQKRAFHNSEGKKLLTFGRRLQQTQRKGTGYTHSAYYRALGRRAAILKLDVPSPFDGGGYTTQTHTPFRHTMDRSKRYESCPNPLRTYLATTRPFRRSRDTQTALDWLCWLVASSELRCKVKWNTAKSIR